MFQGKMQSATTQTFKHELGYHLRISVTQENLQHFLTGKLFKPETEFGKKERILGIINIKLGDWYIQEELSFLSENMVKEANEAVIRLEQRERERQMKRRQSFSPKRPQR